MKAIVQERFGPPETLRLADVEEPVPGPGDVLVRVRAAAVNPLDWHVLRGDPLVARLFGVGLRRPRERVAGVDVAGTVEAVGAGVRDVRPGDVVLGFCRGAFAELGRTAAANLVPVPAGLSMEQAAAIPIAGTTALRAIRDAGEVSAGDRVLVNGAAGGVGTFAVQIAAALGAEVTGVCGGGNAALVRSLGAAHVVDHTREDFTTGRYDVILDNVGNRSLSELRGALTPSGVLVLNAGGSPGKVFGALGARLRAELVKPFAGQRIRPLGTAERREDLLALTALVAGGRLTPVVSHSYALPDAAAAVAHVERGHARGKLVVAVG